MSRFLKHTLRCVVFLAVLALLLTGVSQLVRPKNNTSSDGIHDPAANGILGEPDNTIDLLISITRSSRSPSSIRISPST